MFVHFAADDKIDTPAVFLSSMIVRPDAFVFVDFVAFDVNEADWRAVLLMRLFTSAAFVFADFAADDEVNISGVLFAWITKSGSMVFAVDEVEVIVLLLLG